jgi:hypothetical protein
VGHARRRRGLAPPPAARLRRLPPRGRHPARRLNPRAGDRPRGLSVDGGRYRFQASP